jgi:hypothetical protein
MKHINRLTPWTRSGNFSVKVDGGKAKLSLYATNSALCHEDLKANGCIYLRFLDLGIS